MRAAALLCLIPLACDDARPVPTPTSGRDATVTSSTGRDASTASDASTADASTGDAGQVTGPMGLGLMARLAGLWSGPGTGTRLGSFPRMVIDFRASDPKTLFGRVDLDADNALRMAFYVEGDTLVFRNGGLFMGLSRDTITRLVEVDEARGHYRFCEAVQGCDYNEATLDFSSETALVMDVTVRRQPHLTWSPTRQETRVLPGPFPAAGGVAPGSPFPPMPSLRATIQWTTPLAAAGDAWLILSSGDCSVSACVVSRHFLAHAAPGATSAVLLVDQIHAGDYKVIGFIDRDQNVGATLAPDSGDGVTFPNQALTIAPTGETSFSGSIVFDLP